MNIKGEALIYKYRTHSYIYVMQLGVGDSTFEAWEMLLNLLFS
jgi:hypothetical protein